MIGNSSLSFLLTLIIVPLAERLVKDKCTVSESNGTRVIYMNNQYLCDSVTEAVNKLEELITNIPSKIYHTHAEKEKEEARNWILGIHEIADEQFEKQAKLVTDLPSKIYTYIEKNKEDTNNRIINEMSKLFHKFQEITDEHFEKLGTNLKETLHNTHQHFEKETKKVRSKVNIEIDSVNYRLQDNKFWMWLIVIVVVALIVVLLYLCIFGMTRNKKQFLESGFQEDKMEKSVVIVSFSTANKQLHKSIADTVAGDYKCHELLLGGVKKVSSIELTSQVCLVFVDKNERNIILETEVDISKTRSDFVENLVKQGRTHVVVIYCQHEDSHGLTTLYNRNLGNIRKHKVLRQLQGQNRVLSINKEFSPYQSDYLKVFLNESLTE
eukprot:XP_011437549.1 PREDICTED: uncharacterized protein LOC105335394 [Crassostrea gigas]